MSIWKILGKPWQRVLKRELRVSIRRRYFGTRDLWLVGGVYAAKYPEYRFQVALVDESGNEVAHTIANGPSKKESIPEGYGFVMAVPVDWLLPSEIPRRFQFKICATGELFPMDPPTFPVQRILKSLGADLGEHVLHRERIVKLADNLGKLLPEGEDVLVAVTHELSRTGAPLILLGLLKHLRERHGWRIVLLSEGKPDSLMGEFSACCTLVIPHLGEVLRDSPREVHRLLSLLRQRSVLPNVLVNSLVSHRLGHACHEAGFQVRALIHEYPQAVGPESLRRFISICATAVFPCQDVMDKIVDSLALSDSSTSAAADFRVIPQGCYLLEKESVDPLVYKDFFREFRDQHGFCAGTRLVLCCGTIDVRKGFDWLVTLMRQYAQSSAHAGITHFIWVGKVSDYVVHSFGIHDLQVGGIEGNFTHIQECEDVRPYLSMADAFLLCSRIDPFPSVVMEAFFMGKPVIGFDHYQGCRDFILETGFGRVVPYQNVEVAIQVLDEVLSDSTLAQRVATLGPALIAREFNYGRYADQVQGLLVETATPAA